MGIKKKFLYIVLSIVNVFVYLFPIKKNRIVFVSLESNVLQSDLKLLYEALSNNAKYEMHCIVMKYDKKSIITNFLYMLNTIQQVWYINRSRVVILSDNNYVVSTFKRKGVVAIQIWHATGAIKKFGNALPRQYKIQNYDYVVVNSAYWKQPYKEAFHVSEEAIKVLGMPRVDALFDVSYRQKTKLKLLQRYPFLQNKTVIFYAPTFRGNIYKGFTGVNMDCDVIMKSLSDAYVFIYKLHPLLKDNRLQNAHHAYNMDMEDTHDIFTITDILISDFSSIIFDFSIFLKPILLYTPDIATYFKEVGTYVDIEKEIPAQVCYHEKDLIEGIKKAKVEPSLSIFRDTFFTYQDGKNTDRVISLLDEIIENE